MAGSGDRRLGALTRPPWGYAFGLLFVAMSAYAIATGDWFWAAITALFAVNTLFGVEYRRRRRAR